MSTKKLVFISNMAAPYQIKFCDALQRYFNAEFWFYVHLEPNRPSWWRIPLGLKCKVLDNVLFKRSRRYLSLNIYRELSRFNPDIIMLGGFFFPSNYLAYRWGKRRGKIVVFFSEVNRSRNNAIRRKGAFTRFTRWLYSDVDAILTSSEEATAQFKVDFGFGNKVFSAHYAADLDAYFNHPLRTIKEGYVCLFANRLVDFYNPLLAIEAFQEIQSHYPTSRLLMNASGPLLSSCRERVTQLSLDRNVEFLGEIRTWDDLPRVYHRSDILLLPATFSAGNFTILEAMASGMGIVVSNKILGSGTYISDGVNGFVCEPIKERFVSAIEQYISNPTLFQIHASLNRAIAKKYSVHETARLYHDLIESRLINAQ